MLGLVAIEREAVRNHLNRRSLRQPTAKSELEANNKGGSMLGTIVKPASGIETKYLKSCEVTSLLRKMGRFNRHNVGIGYELSYHHQDRIALKRCVELAKQFKIVSIDETVERKIKTKEGDIIVCSLVFSCNLPLKTITTKRVKGKNGKDYELKSNTPLPTKEGLEAIREHRNKFDKLGLWWVPNEITVEEIKEYDPILVGKIETKFHGSICFELHRWVDENFEAEYWSKEGY